MVKNNQQSKNLSPKRVISFRDLLGIGAGISAMLPILVAAIVTLYWLVYDFIVYKDERVFTLLMNLRISAVLLTPFLVSAIVTGFFIKKSHDSYCAFDFWIFLTLVNNTVNPIRAKKLPRHISKTNTLTRGAHSPHIGSVFTHSTIER